jgi:hypothetical protein
MDPAEAKRLWWEWRLANGRLSYQPILTPPSANVKFAKDGEVLSYGVSLSPDASSGSWNVCPFATPACRAGCVAFSGKGELDSVQAGWRLKTEFLMAHPDAFATLVLVEVGDAWRRFGDRVAVRLNAFSDLRWEEFAPWLFAAFPSVQFYDYTKDWARVDQQLPANYHLTLSVSERTSDEAARARLASGANLAVVFDVKRGRELPATWLGFRVIDGDRSDARHLDPAGVVVGLRAKGRMRGDRSGMVRGVA